MQDFEKLGSFYLGRAWNATAGAPADELLLYDARNLTTHAVCIGMTGSGKTGLCIDLLEEACLDSIPVLAIDPKGDVANLMLAFPDLAPADFLPWVDADEARRRGVDVETLAREEAARWTNGLAEWGQDGARIRRLRDAADVVVYTPGSSAGVPVSIVQSFAAPPPALRASSDELRERAAAAATSVLGLLGVDADPLQSRDHVLLTTLFAAAWERGESLDLAALVNAIRTPPMPRVGVLDLETFYPAKERFELAMRLNNVLAAPGFQTWLQGAALDVDALLFGQRGKPRVAVFCIAHLSDPERMFFVSLLLQQTLTWVRAQPGTGSLRAILYMDEIFGYFPPSAEPPSKKPLLTLMKQARAAGLGVVLATQNPVDLDYKGLANAGTWFVGRLQTERDRARVLDGLEAAGGALDRHGLDTLLGGLAKRVFLLHDVHGGEPRTFMTRWTMSYLRGPLTREEIRRLATATAAATAAATGTAAAAVTASGTAALPSGGAASAPASGDPVPAPAAAAPVLPPDVPQTVLAMRGGAVSSIVYEARLFGVAGLRFVDLKAGLDVAREAAILAALPATAAEAAWTGGVAIEASAAGAAPVAGARWGAVPALAAQARSYVRWKKELTDWLYREQRLVLRRSSRLAATSGPDESERDFRIRLRDLWRERRDADVEALRAKYGPRFERLRAQQQRATAAQAREAEQLQQQKVQSAISIGATVLGAFLGGKRSGIGRATTAARSLGRSRKEAADVERAAADVAAVETKLQALEAEFQTEVAALDAGFDAEREPLETVALRARKTDIDVRSVSLAWVPLTDEDGVLRPAWR